MIFGWLRFGSVIEIPIGVFGLGLYIRCVGMRLRFGRRGLGGGLRVDTERGADSGAQVDVILAAAQQIPECENDAEDHHEQQKQPDQVPAFQYEIAAVFPVS